MKVTKYPQSCLILEKEGKRLAIDPGSLVSAKYKATDLWPLDGIIITHEHQDHADPELLRALISNAQIPVVGNESTSKVLGEIINKVVADNEEVDIAGFHLQAKELPHCVMVDGSAGPQNTGYVIDGAFFHPGDGIAIEGVRTEAAAVPFAGPDISPHDVYSFIQQVGCKTLIPIHYDYFPADTDFYRNMLNNMDGSLRIITLENGESAEI